MIIRRAQVEDLDQLSSLFDAYRIFYKQESDLSAAKQFLHERFQNKDSVIFLAIDGQKESVGFIQLFDSFTSVGMSKIWLLNDLFVNPKSRTKGVAEALMNAAKSHAIATNRPKIILETGFDNVKAQMLYQKLNYQKSSSFIYELNI